MCACVRACLHVCSCEVRRSTCGRRRHMCAAPRGCARVFVRAPMCAHRCACRVACRPTRARVHALSCARVRLSVRGWCAGLRARAPMSVRTRARPHTHRTLHPCIRTTGVHPYPCARGNKLPSTRNRTHCPTVTRTRTCPSRARRRRARAAPPPPPRARFQRPNGAASPCGRTALAHPPQRAPVGACEWGTCVRAVVRLRTHRCA